jgi:DNA-binding MarR family transcriptional regulator
MRVLSVTVNEPGRPARQPPRARRERPAEEACDLADALARLHLLTRLWQCFLAAHKQIVGQLADEMLTEHQLPLEWFDVLVHLADLPGMRGLQKELRDRMLLSESGVSRLLALMGKAGVITRRSAGDGQQPAPLEAARPEDQAGIPGEEEPVYTCRPPGWGCTPAPWASSPDVLGLLPGRYGRAGTPPDGGGPWRERSDVRDRKYRTNGP